MKLADNQDKHKISDGSEFRPDWFICFGVNCLNLNAENFDLQWGNYCLQRTVPSFLTGLS